MSSVPISRSPRTNELRPASNASSDNELFGVEVLTSGHTQTTSSGTKVVVRNGFEGGGGNARLPFFDKPDRLEVVVFSLVALEDGAAAWPSACFASGSNS